MGPETFVDITWDGPPEVEIATAIINDGMPTEVLVESFLPYDTYVGDVVFTWEDESTCRKELTVHVVPM